MPPTHSNDSLALVLEILTPLHVGTGDDFLLNEDFLRDQEKLFVVDREATLRAISEGQRSLDKLSNDKWTTLMLQDLVNMAGERTGYDLPWFSHPVQQLQKVRCFLKDAFWNPYIPGSSLKGAVRTAFTADWLRQQQGDPTKWTGILNTMPKAKGSAKNAARSLESHLFGPDPQQSLWRTVKIGDVGFKRGSLQAVDIRCLNLKDGNTMQWRNLADPPRNVPDWRAAGGWVVEALPPGTSTPITWLLDRFLHTRSDWKKGVVAQWPDTFAEWQTILNRHAAHRLQEEHQFFSAINYEQGKRQVETLQAEMTKQPDAAYLQMAWGSGWRGMTGNWMTPELLQQMRSLFSLGRATMEFPKTRRLAVQREPTLPLGWIRLWSGDQAKNKLNLQHEQSSPTATWLREAIARLAKQHNSKPEVIWRGSSLAQEVQSISDLSMRQDVVKAIRNYWQRAENGWWDQPPGGAATRAKTIYLSILDS